VSLLFFLVFTTTLAAPQRERGTSIQPLKTPTANHLPVILKINTVTCFKIFSGLLSNLQNHRWLPEWLNKHFEEGIGRIFTISTSAFINASQKFIFYLHHNKAAKKF
jgi:hypothetical protein